MHQLARISGFIPANTSFLFASQSKPCLTSNLSAVASSGIGVGADVPGVGEGYMCVKPVMRNWS